MEERIEITADDYIGTAYCIYSFENGIDPMDVNDEFWENLPFDERFHYIMRAAQSIMTVMHDSKIISIDVSVST